MTIMTVRANAQCTSPPDAALASLVDAVGEDRFGPALARFLNELCGADHFAAFRFGKDELREVARVLSEELKKRGAEDILELPITKIVA